MLRQALARARKDAGLGLGPGSSRPGLDADATGDDRTDAAGDEEGGSADAAGDEAVLAAARLLDSDGLVDWARQEQGGGLLGWGSCPG